MKVRRSYLLLAALVFAIELAIALGVLKGPLVRGSLGDVLVVILLYCLVRGLIDTRPLAAATGVFAFACCIEALQYIYIADRLGLAKGSVLSIALGNTFSVLDIVMYFIGCVIAYALDRYCLRREPPDPADKTT